MPSSDQRPLWHLGALELAALIRRREVSARDATASVLARLRGAGAVIVGRSNSPAFSLRWFTDNDLHGRARNPFDPW